MAFIRGFKDEDVEMVKHICRDTLPASMDGCTAAIRMAPYLWALAYTTLCRQQCFVLDDGTGRAVGYILGSADVFSQMANKGPSSPWRKDWVAGVLARNTADVHPPSAAALVDNIDDAKRAVPELPAAQLVASGDADPSVLQRQRPGDGELMLTNPERMAEEAYRVEWMALGHGVTGMEAVVRKYRSMLHINLLEEFRGCGWGRKMLEVYEAGVRKSAAAAAAADNSSAAGAGGEGEQKQQTRVDYGKGIRLGVSLENTKVVPFYEKCGYRVYPGGEAQGCVWMVKDL